jgi:hypothetical protein
MRSKKVRGLLLTLFTLTLVINNVFAAEFPITTIYMTDGEGSYIQKDTFSSNEIPWLYFRVPIDPGDQKVTSTSWWSDIFGNSYQVRERENEIDIWHSIKRWNSIKTEGLWIVEAEYSFGTGRDKVWGSGSTSFTVTPEPISSILFVTGGATLAVRYWRKKKILK